MSVDERDPHSGYKTTGHEWNGIKELNTPVPRPVYFFLIVTFLFSIGYWVLMPAWPTGLSYTKGLLGLDQRASVEREVAQAAAARAPWMNALVRTPYEQALADPALMARVRDTGATLFGDNCAACHGANGAGAPGFPNLRDDIWLWGGAPDTIAETIRVGVNSGHADARVSQMMAFGRDQMLPQEDVRAVIAYVRSLSAARAPAPSATLTRGAVVFANTCASCHGARGEGIQQMGAPSLIDSDWLYGGDQETIFQTVWHGRQGQMPAWEGRLSASERRLLTLYLLDQQRRRQ
ncbi:MAG: cytochrome-c oxidase, cbb3-type subunit III [Hyphomonadaceae bacterium]|nr:cytochrome-c oxidase, cbb3-type subunit III [Hyphomonadaceae bacterium]